MREELVSLLTSQKQNKYTFEGVDVHELIQELLKEIGNPDPVIRDELIYPNLAHLLHDNHFSKEELNRFAEELISTEYLLFDMENLSETSVLKRSFSTLQLVILVYVHNRDHLFSEAFVHLMFETFMQYFENEEILTGHHQTYGWMHAIAHSADLFAQLFKVQELGVVELERMFNLIATKIMIGHYQYVSDEDERMVTALVRGLERNLLTDDFLIDWLTRIGQVEAPTEYPEAYHFKTNKKNFLRSLYFRLLHDTKYANLVSILEQMILDIEKRR